MDLLPPFETAEWALDRYGLKIVDSYIIDFAYPLQQRKWLGKTIYGLLVINTGPLSTQGSIIVGDDYDI
jgi:hypothetical protein